MADDLLDLARTRAEIDRIDDSIVDLLVARMEKVAGIARAKGVGDGRLAIRPAREAEVMRQVLDRVAGRWPAGSIARIWREIVGAAIERQTPLTAIVQAPATDPATLELAREHLGSLARLVRADSCSQALGALRAGTAQIAVLGAFDPQDRWWTRLPPCRPDGPCVFARAPMIEPATEAGRTGSGQVWMVSAIAPTASGQDLTLLRLETETPLSSDRIVEPLAAAGLHPRHLDVARRSDGEGALHLLELDGFFAQDDTILDNALASLKREAVHAVVLGAYPKPWVARSAD